QSVEISDGGAIAAYTLDASPAGLVLIDTDDLVIKGVTSPTLASLPYIPSSSLAELGQFTPVNLPTSSVLIADTFSTGAAGTIEVTAKTIEVTAGGIIEANTSSSGRGGIITLCCADTFTVDGVGSALLAGSAAGSTGDAGGIGFATSHLILSN